MGKIKTAEPENNEVRERDRKNGLMRWLERAQKSLPHPEHPDVPITANNFQEHFNSSVYMSSSQ